MKKIALILNSHSLSNFQRCEKLHQLVDIQKMEPRKDYRPFKRGGVITLALARYYEGQRLTSIGERIPDDGKIENIYKFISENPDLSEEDQLLISTRFLKYVKHYKNEKVKVLAIEKGFSKVIYEDKYVYFVYEGTPDFIGNSRNLGIHFMDHKSESRKSDIYVSNNQFLGYSFGTGCELGMVNYFGLQTTGDSSEWFRRETISFRKSQIEQWKKETIAWFWRIAQIRRSKSFIRSRQCEGKYGVCTFHKVCDIVEENFRKDYLEKHFKKGGRRHSFVLENGEI